MTLTICGGGNLGHVIAAFAAHHGNEVQLLTRHPERWSHDITIDTPEGMVFTGHISSISAHPEEVIPQSDIILLCLPGYGIADCLRSIAPLLSPQGGKLGVRAVGSVVSSTGFFFEALKLLPATTPLFGFQRVPFIARVAEYGHSAHLLGYKPQLHMAVEHMPAPQQLQKEIAQLFRTDVVLLNSHYEVSLTNSNPLLHPSRLYDLWHDWHEGLVYPRVPLFYEEWTERAAQLYIDMDNELQQLLQVLPVRPGSIPTVLDYYESTDAASLARKLRSIEAFKGIPAPMQPVADGFVPDFQSRYFTEDFPYGLAIVRRLMHEHRIIAPTIERIYQWGISSVGASADNQRQQ